MVKDPRDRKYGAVIDLLPKNYSEYPILFKKDELGYLDGSLLQQNIISEADALNNAYQFI